MIYLYTLLLYLLIPFVLLSLYWRGRKIPEYRRRWAERFGFIAALPAAGCIWIHAVSVGETRAALPLIRALQKRWPTTALLVTTTTPTGSRQVCELLGNAVWHVYAPYDLPAAVTRFLSAARPRLALIMETELWPNLFARCASLNIPLIVANARLSERSARRYQRLRPLVRQMLSEATLIAAQAEADAARFRELGAPRVKVTGNLKFDLTLPAGLPDQGRELRRGLGAQRPVLIAASTHPGEEEQILDACKRLYQNLPDLLLVLVPRHPERSAQVAELCQRRGFTVVARSERRGCSADTQVFLGNTLGEMLLFYAAADVAFVGGSLVPVGGHNVLEPTLLGLPVLFGLHMFNFSDASQKLLQAQAAWQVADSHELATIATKLLTDPVLREAAGKRGQTVLQANRGALAKLLEIIEEMLKQRGLSVDRSP